MFIAFVTSHGLVRLEFFQKAGALLRYQKDHRTTEHFVERSRTNQAISAMTLVFARLI